ncbi:reverse transcriptase domain-containing protein [Tanacetum coccineum]
MVTGMGIRHAKPYTLRGGPLTKLEQRSGSQTHVLHLHQGLPAKIEIVMVRAPGPSQAKNIIKEVHEGSYGMHSGPRFGRPQEIISDNGKQFGKDTFLIFCKKLGTLQASTSVYHPQANGHVKVTNREIIKGMERRLGKAHKAWIDELPQRVQDFDPKENKKRRREDLDILEERREMASIKEAHNKQKLEGYYNKNVKPSTFKPGTYVLQLNSASKAEYQGKMGPTWEGPYMIRKAYGYGAYKLETLSGEAVNRTWNGTNIHKFYV